MARKHRNVDSIFKAKVALEALKGHRMVDELAAKHELQASQINLWKKQLLDGAVLVFEDESGKQVNSDEPQTTELYEQIDRLKARLEWLNNKMDTDNE